MKVLLNVSLDAVKLDEWHPCEGLKLVEAEDGSLDLIVTSDLERALKADEDQAAFLERLKASA